MFSGIRSRSSRPRAEGGSMKQAVQQLAYHVPPVVLFYAGVLAGVAFGAAKLLAILKGLQD